MEFFLAVMVFVLGMCIGSFINMAVWRVANGKPILGRNKLRPYSRGLIYQTLNNRSYCDFCGKQLSWYDNIPVFSWLFYRGKSRCCGKKLPLLYPIVEISTGCLFLLNYSARGGSAYGGQSSIFNLQSIVVYMILGLLVFEAAFDFKYMVIPDRSAYALIGLVAIRWLILGAKIEYLYTALLSALFIFILHKIKIKGQQAMGDGDIFLAFFMGLFLGFPGIILAFYLAFIVGAVVGIILIMKKKVKKLSPIPFGPFLILGTVVAFFWGEEIIKIIKF
ncbi:MAG TPA: prepilin peptidase [Candidatus Woesebacteria bacterium]|nr:prepilin peptidase [Candidatus Shapirobacteria bacterium]HOY61341.1 prepilin peptidase [Candidatus Woesebacteria bacterium]